MTNQETSPEFFFEPPGPGTWTLDPVHFPRPVTRYWTETHPAAFLRGTQHMANYYGMLIDGLGTAYLNGFAYNSMRHLDEEQVPLRFGRAEEVFQNKLWREQLREWDQVRKPASIAAHRDLQAVDPDALSDEALIAYLRRCRDHHSAMITQHMSFTGGATLPVGDFLAHVGDWTGLAPAELLGLTRGSAPVSAGASAQLERLIAAIGQDPTALALLESNDDAGGVLASLRSLPGDAGSAVSDYLDLVGFRPLDGFDISEPSALELPDSLLRSIRVTVSGRDLAGSDVNDLISGVRDKVPPEHRDQFDELLAEARLTYRLRDERGVYSDIWASGLMRRAVLAAGRRLVAAGRIQDANQLIDAGLEEMCSLVSGATGPTAKELAERYEYRATHSAKDAPALLGDPPSPPPDPSKLPPAAARLMRAMGISLGAIFGSSEVEHEEHLLRGLAASRGVYEGPARRVSGPSEFDRIVQGDVLVTESTTEAFNILLPLLGAIVTDNGGLLSHSAIVAREYGIPGVVGTRDATELIADGTRVRVDGDVGEVTVLT
jgi:phosphohistidine swiveling domain-containing protein